MAMPVSNEIRNKIIKHKENKEKQSDIAKWLMISESTITKVWARYIATGSYEPSPRTQGRKSAVDEVTMAKVENKIKETPDMTLLELIAEFNLGISESALSRKLKKLGYSYKKNKPIRQSETIPKCRKNAWHLWKP
jgi:transposase